PIRGEVADELSNTVGSGTLHVGNLAPELLGYGYIHDDGVLLESGASVPQNLRGLCPRQNFKAGLIVRHPEADSLQVTGVIVETGETMQLSRTDGNVFIGEMKAPQWPRYYTLRLEATEVPPDQVVSATLPL